MKKIIILFIIIFSIYPIALFAAEVSFSSLQKNYPVNEDFLMSVFLDTQGESVNAVAGSVVFPANILELKEVRDGNSAVNFWVEEPHLSSGDTIDFSGITTGGFSGDKMFLFSLVLNGKNPGQAVLDFARIQILKNDGRGTKLTTTSNSFTVKIIADNNSTNANDLHVIDTDQPESFIPFIGQDSTVFDGKYFVVFSTKDKASGIDHYEVRESFLGFDGTYVEATSPYLLQSQSLMKKTYVKAVDKNGNSKIVSIPPQNHLAWLLQTIFIAIILLVCIFAYRKIFQKR